MDISSLIISGAKMLGAKFVKDNLGSFDIRKHLTKEKEELSKAGENVTLEKLQLIAPYADFCALPHFEVENATMNRELTDSFYKAARKLVFDLNYSETDFEYCSKNYSANDVSDKLELIEFLNNEQLNLTRNDSRYYLGFRSFYFSLRQNIQDIDFVYMSELNKSLTPFFLSYRHKELFIPGLEFISNKE